MEKLTKKGDPLSILFEGSPEFKAKQLLWQAGYEVVPDNFIIKARRTEEKLNRTRTFVVRQNKKFGAISERISLVESNMDKKWASRDYLSGLKDARKLLKHIAN